MRNLPSSNADTPPAQAQETLRLLPQRTPGAHRRDELGESSAFVFDEHEGWSSEARQAASRFLARQEAP